MKIVTTIVIAILLLTVATVEAEAFTITVGASFVGIFADESKEMNVYSMTVSEWDPRTMEMTVFIDPNHPFEAYASIWDDGYLVIVPETTENPIYYVL